MNNKEKLRQRSRLEKSYVAVKVRRDLYARIHKIADGRLKIQVLLEDLIEAGIKAIYGNPS